MRKRTSRIYPDGITECNEVYAPFSDGWQYCDAIYKCDENGAMTCLWKKLAEETYIGVFQSVKWYVTWKNKLYAFAKVYKGGTGVVAHEGDFLEYDYQTGKWYVVKELGKTPFCPDGLIMTDEGAFGSSGYNGYFLDFKGNDYTLPVDDEILNFYANGTTNVYTNKGYYDSRGYIDYETGDIIATYGTYYLTMFFYKKNYIYGFGHKKNSDGTFTDDFYLVRFIPKTENIVAEEIGFLEYGIPNGYDYGFGFFHNGQTVYLYSLTYKRPTAIGQSYSDYKLTVYDGISFNEKMVVSDNSYTINLVAVSPDEKIFAFCISKKYNYYVKIGTNGDEILVPEKAYGSSMDLSLFHFVEDINYKGTDENDKKYDLYYFTTKLTGTNPGDINTGMIYER